MTGALGGIDFSGLQGTFLIMIVVPFVTQLLYAAAERDSRKLGRKRRVDYPGATKLFVWVGWGFTLILGTAMSLAMKSAEEEDWGTVIFLVLFFTAMILPLHLEFYFSKIEWDKEFVYTRSPWRRRRKIPISEIEECTFSKLGQCYRIKTKRSGSIWLILYARGIPQFMKILPVSHPGYPPDSF